MDREPNLAKAGPRAVLKIPSVRIYGPSPLTGLVLWSSHDKLAEYSRSISLEFSYFSYNDVTVGSVKNGYTFDWSPIKNFLATAKARGHHAILRFRDTDPDLPAPGIPRGLVLKRVTAEYDENIPGVPHRRKVHFPDWSNPALAKFYIDFFRSFGEAFDRDQTLAIVQVGFGLWGEYHLDFSNLKKFSDPSITTVSRALGKIFPSKADQLKILAAIKASLKKTPVGISIDAADAEYTDFARGDAWRGLGFGHFDDSFLAAIEKEEIWSVFPNAKTGLNGGEISYYNENDQKEALSHEGPNGVSLATAAKERAFTYLLANDQTKFHGPDRIAAAGKNLGYALTIENAWTEADVTTVIVLNSGAAPVHFDIFPEIAGLRAVDSLQGLQPGHRRTVVIKAVGSPRSFRFWSPELLDGQVIPFTGNERGDLTEGSSKS